jgi:hypothetical protein
VSNSGTTLNAVFDFVLPRGIQGDQGIQGPKGDQGDSINVKASVATVGDLPTVGNNAGDARVVIDTGDLHVWDGSVWNNVGQFQGPQGIQGPQGPQGIQGDSIVNIDGGFPDSDYGGITAIDGGVV